MVVPVTLSWSAGSVGKACTITGSAELLVLMDIEQTDTRRDDNTPPTTVVANLPIDSSFWNVPTSYSVGITSFFNLFFLFPFSFFLFPFYFLFFFFFSLTVFFVRLFAFRFVLKPTQKNKQELTLGCSLFRMDNQTQVPLFKSILSLISPYFSFFLSLLKERI